MSATTRAIRLLAKQQPARFVSFHSAAVRAPIRQHLSRSAAVTTTRNQNRWKPWMVATAATAGMLSWQLGHSLVYSDSPAKPNTVIDKDSKAEFPLYIPSEDGSPARLLGLGVRKITFLKVQVYVVGLYIKASDLDDHNSRFRALPEVQKFQRTDQQSADIAFRAIVQTPIELILRIQPVKNTNGPHLRDGFIRNLTQAAKEQKLSDVENEEAMKGIMELKNLFPKGKINTNQALLFHRTPDGTLTVQMDGEALGSMRNTWVIENIFFGYLQGDHPISEKARDSIAEGIQNLLLQ